MPLSVLCVQLCLSGSAVLQGRRKWESYETCLLTDRTQSALESFPSCLTQRHSNKQPGLEQLSVNYFSVSCLPFSPRVWLYFPHVLDEVTQWCMGTDIIIYISFAGMEVTNINAACGYTASKWRTESSIDVRYGGTKMHSASIKITMLHIDNIEHCSDKICLLIQ